MDKLVGELLSPFAQRLSKNGFFASVLFWAVGLYLFHRFPSRFPHVCPSGGQDICGLFSTNTHQVIITGAVMGALVLVTTFGFFDQTATVAQVLSGARWPIRQLPIRWQAHRRERMSERGYGTRISSPNAKKRRIFNAQTRKRPISIRCRQRADLYPHGMPRNPPPDPKRPVDVALEPTLLGNIFAATRQQLLATVGIRLHSCWQLLLIVIPDEARTRLAGESAVLLARTQTVMWFSLSCVWAVWLPAGWKIVLLMLCLSSAYLAYRSVCTAAVEYCAQLKAVILANRTRLYKAVGFPLPTSTEDDVLNGTKLCGWLDRNGPRCDVERQWSPNDSS